ncbi:MAG TPA: hypothetical protein VLI94_10790 [Solirubrobacterales bacterium]|nr:hypothetical protein [Solirubrobacterales bacterium]
MEAMLTTRSDATAGLKRRLQRLPVRAQFPTAKIFFNKLRNRATNQWISVRTEIENN